MNRLFYMLVLLFGLLLPAQGAHADAELTALVSGFSGYTNRTNVAVSPTNAASPVNEALRDSHEVLTTTNLVTKPGATNQHDRAREFSGWQQRLEIARRQRLQRLYAAATPTLIDVVISNTSDEQKRTALLELAIIAQEEHDLTKAQQIYAHYMAKWPDDPSTPEVLLRQGLILRQMGLNHLALTKFYAVMTSALVLKADNLGYYQRIVLQAQTEIAETYFMQGKFQDSIEFFSRLLKSDSTLLNRPQIQFKLVRALSSLERWEDVTVRAYEFLNRYQDAAEQPEVRFHLATALKRLGRNSDSLQQVLLLLQDQQGRARAHPETWAYWQQRTGNEVANQLYKEGDYLRALDVYSSLATLSSNADWQLPVWYQIGLTFERLEQPVRAIGQYGDILRREPEVGTNSAPSLRAILEMARWRQQYIGWQTNTESVLREFKTARLAPPEPSPKP